MRVRVKASHYYGLKKGAIGEVVGKKFEGTNSEVWRVRFNRKDSSQDEWFIPRGRVRNGITKEIVSELEVLDA